MATDRRRTFLHALAFVLGFSLVFVTLGASVALVGYALHRYIVWVQKIGGALIIVDGGGLLCRMDTLCRAGAGGHLSHG